MISYIIPTRDRPERLAQTLDAIASLPDHAGLGGAEVIVVDNASTIPPAIAPMLRNGIGVRVLRRAVNLGAAARNDAADAADPRSTWLVMLDDDSYPIDMGLARALSAAPHDAAAVMADIVLPGGQRESGGLPEVFVGCGVAIRRSIFLQLGGYDAAFGYYAEEYDLAARIILAGYRIVFDPWFRVRHHKVGAGRDMDLILSRLIRNNGWVAQRYAPESLRRAELREARGRYRGIADKEHATRGYAQGLIELRGSIRAQPRTPMPPAMHDRFTGLSAAREALSAAHAEQPFRTAAIIDEGKNAWVVRRSLAELGVREVHADASPDALVIGTMSPGPMLDAYERRSAVAIFRGARVVAPWTAVRSKASPGAEALVPPRVKIPA